MSDLSELPDLKNAQPGQQIEIPDRLFFRIGEVSEMLGVKAYVLRYWETEFSLIHPDKSSTGQRLYKRADVEALLLVKHLLYNERYSIDGARKRIRELKRDGKLAAYKKEKIFGTEEAKARKDVLQKVKEQSARIQELTQKPLKEFFQY